MLDENLHKFEQKEFQNDLINWFYEYKRDLPWRKTKDPYYIWISEVMLQQTKVDTVISYYNKFTERYPTIFDLAKAPEQEVLKEWEGLGYYSRARNLHEAVKEVVSSYNGHVPKDPQLLGKLKGIGPYTKGAIASIAFGLAEPAVDGNVMRVLARILLISDNIMEQKTRRRFEVIVREIISEKDPSAFNQALMELGALICIPRTPRCDECPVKSHCRAYSLGHEKDLPVRITKKRNKLLDYTTVCLFDEAGRVAIEQRPEAGLLANLWQFPMFEKEKIKKDALVELFAEKYGLSIIVEEKLGNVKHVFSHLTWNVTVHQAIIKDEIAKNKQLTFVPLEDLKTYPISVAHQKVMNYLL